MPLIIIYNTEWICFGMGTHFKEDVWCQTNICLVYSMAIWVCDWYGTSQFNPAMVYLVYVLHGHISQTTLVYTKYMAFRSVYTRDILGI